jgi:hypothetical protein
MLARSVGQVVDHERPFDAARGQEPPSKYGGLPGYE